MRLFNCYSQTEMSLQQLLLVASEPDFQQLNQHQSHLKSIMSQLNVNLEALKSNLGNQEATKSGRSNLAKKPDKVLSNVENIKNNNDEIYKIIEKLNLNEIKSQNQSSGCDESVITYKTVLNFYKERRKEIRKTLEERILLYKSLYSNLNKIKEFGNRKWWHCFILCRKAKSSKSSSNHEGQKRRRNFYSRI